MAGIISTALAKVKENGRSLLAAEQIVAVCRAVGHRWRQREFGPVETVHLFLLQILHGNTALTHLSHLWGSFVNASAFCEARKRLPLAVWQRLLELVGKQLVDESQTLWKGMRVWLVDGSGFSMPDVPELARHFGYPGHQRKGCGFPVARLMVLMDLATGCIRHIRALPMKIGEMTHMPMLHESLKRGDLMVADRAFCSYAHLAVLVQKGIHAVLRVHASQRVDFTPGRAHSSWTMRRKSANKPTRLPRGAKRRPRRLPPTSRWVKTLGPFDQVVAWSKSDKSPGWLGADEFAYLPEELLVRETRYHVEVPGFRVQEVTLVSTLLDAEEFPASELARLYGWRWRIETNLRHLKITMRLDVLKCRTVDGVCKELAVFALVYNLVRMVMQAAARVLEVPIERISFIDAMRWLASGGRIPLVNLIVNADRSNRYEPRVRKRRPKHYPLMTQPREILRKRMRDKSM
jgi:hypothetical protein